MARVFMTGFEDGSVGAFTAISGVVASTTQKRTGAYSMYIAGGGGRTASYTFNAEKAEIYARFGLYWSSTNQPGLFAVYDVSNVIHMRLDIDQASGLPKLYLGAALVLTGTTPLLLTIWTCVEIYIKIADDAAGRYTVKFNGATVLAYSGITANSLVLTLRRMMFGDVGPGNVPCYIDDIAVNDVAGGVNDTWIGQGGIRLAFVDGESATHAVDFTPSVPGTNWSLVDEIPASDADYVEDDTVDEYDLYTLDTSSMPVAGTVSAVKWIARAKLDIDGATITPVIRSEATTEQQADIAVTATYAEKSLIMDLDPIDNQPWTLVKVNALEIGMAVG